MGDGMVAYRIQYKEKKKQKKEENTIVSADVSNINLAPKFGGTIFLFL